MGPRERPYFWFGRDRAQLGRQVQYRTQGLVPAFVRLASPSLAAVPGGQVVRSLCGRGLPSAFQGRGATPELGFLSQGLASHR
eukprot:11164272-Lingulodinium_polyedra.AAC.1